MIGEEEEKPVLRVVAGGAPTPAELAAVVVALAAAATARPADGKRSDRRRGGWADRSAGLRRPLRAGVEAWRAHGR